MNPDLAAALAGGQGDPSTLLRSMLLEQRPELAPLLDATSTPPAKAPSDQRRADPRLLALLDDADRALDRLAAALGACLDCWGTDPGCPECGGVGRPGWTTPDPRLFAHYVAPAVRRVTQEQKGGKHSNTHRPESARQDGPIGPATANERKK